MVLFLLLLLNEPIPYHALSNTMPGSRAKVGEYLHIGHFGWFEIEQRIDLAALQGLDEEGYTSCRAGEETTRASE